MVQPEGEVQWERMLPHQMERAVTERPTAYVPLGTLEWHGRQNCFGVDALKAHALCRLAALEAGGVLVGDKVSVTLEVEAVKQALGHANMSIGDVDLYEINEAFAVQVLAFLEHFGIADDDPRVNEYGGAIATGGMLRDAVAHLAESGALGPALKGEATGYVFVYHAEIFLLFLALVAIGPLVRLRHVAQRDAAHGSTLIELRQ